MYFGCFSVFLECYDQYCRQRHWHTAQSNTASEKSFWNFLDKRSEYPMISGNKSYRNGGTEEASLCGYRVASHLNFRSIRPFVCH